MNWRCRAVHRAVLPGWASSARIPLASRLYAGDLYSEPAPSVLKGSCEYIKLEDIPFRVD